jgi:CRP-like cAMP-binding protein
MNNLEALSSHYLFHDLTLQQRDQILAIAEKITLPKDAYIIHEGDLDNALYLIIEGTVGVMKRDSLSTIPHQIARLHAGDLIGEISLIDASPRSASVVALEPCYLLALPLALLKSGPYAQILQNLLKKLTHKLRVSNECTAQAMQTELDGAKIRVETGRFLFSVLVLLSVWIFLRDFTTQLVSHVKNTSLITIPIIVVLAVLGGMYIKKSIYAASFYGMTLKRWQRDLLEGVVFSLPLLALGIALKGWLIHSVPHFQGDSLFDMRPETLLPGALYVLITPFQEFVARGCFQSSIQASLSSHRSVFWAIFLSNLIFASFHAFISMTYALFAWVAGFFWGWLYARQRSLIGCIASHMLIGAVFIVMLGFGMIFRGFKFSFLF